MRNRKAMVEAALFMTSRYITAEEIAKMFRITPEEVRGAIDEIAADLNSEDRGIFLLKGEHGYRLFVKPEYTKYVRSLASYHDLSRGVLRVLALVAYKQPITQSQIVKVIGNRTYEYVKELVDKGLITTVKHGRTKALVPTRQFAEYFGIQSPEDAKKLLSASDIKKADEAKEESKDQSEQSQELAEQSTEGVENEK